MVTTLIGLALVLLAGLIGAWYEASVKTRRAAPVARRKPVRHSRLLTGAEGVAAGYGHSAKALTGAYRG